MDIDKRREKILGLLKQSEDPITAKQLGERLGVSRQVIVNDIAFIRARGKEIMSTNKGYIIERLPGYIDTIKVNHREEDTDKELYTIVDNGAQILDVYINHDYYGKISAELNLASRRDVNDFLEKVEIRDLNLLTDLTDGTHYHTIIANNREDMEHIKKELYKKDILIK